MTRFERLLVGASLLVCLPFLGKPPVIDEESYLWLGSVLEFSRPYAWSRAWQGQDGAVYAHPPLWLAWMATVRHLGDVALQRLASLVWVALYAGATARLASRCCHHAENAALAWLGSTVVLLGLHDSLMIDLPYVALSTAALALWRDAEEAPRKRVLAALLLGVAVETKYPAVLFLPVLAVHALRRGGLASLGWALVPIGMVEVPLALQLDAPHPWLAWQARDRIAHGPLAGRLLGVITRSAILPFTGLLFRTNPLSAAAGAGVGVLIAAVVRPAGLGSSGDALLLVAFAALGGAGLGRASSAAFASPLRRRKGDFDAALLLGGWILATASGVVLFHNYAAARYLLPAAAPLAILLARSAEEVAGGKTLLRVSAAFGGIVALAVAIADYRYALAAEEVARKVAASSSTGAFSGEWTFRWSLEAAGWTRWQGGPAPVLAVADNAAGERPDEAQWEPVQRVVADDHLPLRVVDQAGGVGLYAETIGPLPLGLGGAPLEGATLYAPKAP